VLPVFSAVSFSVVVEPEPGYGGPRRVANTMRLEDLKPNAAVRGILPDCLVTVVGIQWFGSEALELTYKDPGGRPANTLLYRHD
jgi:hypothetical protein